MSFTLPELPYPTDALEPYMSRETLEFHHGKHHQAYVTQGNALLEGSPLASQPLEDIVRSSHGSQPALFNNAGQHYNHTHFWKWMKPGGGGGIPARLSAQINKDFGSEAEMRDQFVKAGMGQFGSGWCWLAVRDGTITVEKTPNGESPLLSGGTPILGCDVWEHAYYIDYRNRRPDYLKAFLDHLVNWEYVESRFSAAT